MNSTLLNQKADSFKHWDDELVLEDIRREVSKCDQDICACSLSLISQKVGSCTPTETGRQGLLSPSMITFQRVASQALRKTFLSCKWDKGEDLDLTEVEKEFTMASFLE